MSDEVRADKQETSITDAWSVIAEQSGDPFAMGLQAVALALDEARVDYGWEPYHPGDASSIPGGLFGRELAGNERFERMGRGRPAGRGVSLRAIGLFPALLLVPGCGLGR